jgi:hypothetical protein
MQPKTSKTKKTAAKQKKEITFPLGKENFVIIGIGIAVLLIGYILMGQNSVDGFLPTVVSPIVLLLGYCVIIPYGILKRPKKEAESGAADLTVDTNVSVTTSGSVSSNVKTS